VTDVIQQLRPKVAKILKTNECSLQFEAARGGDICQSWVLLGLRQKFFLKFRLAVAVDFFDVEAQALTEIRQSQSIGVPNVVSTGQVKSGAFIVLEHLDLTATDNDTDKLLGERLAALHLVQQKSFGWHRNNYIGATAQINTFTDSWDTFFLDHRLTYQCRLLQQHHSGRWLDQLSRLAGRMGEYFSGYDVFPSLLHGDLWAGNYAACHGAEPVIYDPASYYGDRETDLAMTELFGGFSPAFYESYHQCLPIHSGYRHRKKLYQLYHLLNHANLFGGHYLTQSQSLLKQLSDDPLS